MYCVSNKYDLIKYKLHVIIFDWIFPFGILLLRDVYYFIVILYIYIICVYILCVGFYLGFIILQ